MHCAHVAFWHLAPFAALHRQWRYWTNSRQRPALALDFCDANDPKRTWTGTIRTFASLSFCHPGIWYQDWRRFCHVGEASVQVFCL